MIKIQSSSFKNCVINIGKKWILKMLIPQYLFLLLKLTQINTVSLNTVFLIPQNQCYPGTSCSPFICKIYSNFIQFLSAIVNHYFCNILYMTAKMHQCALCQIGSLISLLWIYFWLVSQVRKWFFNERSFQCQQSNC